MVKTSASIAGKVEQLNSKSNNNKMLIMLDRLTKVVIIQNENAQCSAATRKTVAAQGQTGENRFRWRRKKGANRSKLCSSWSSMLSKVPGHTGNLMNIRFRLHHRPKTNPRLAAQVGQPPPLSGHAFSSSWALHP